MSDGMTDRQGQDPERRETVAVRPQVNPSHMTHLKAVALADVEGLERAEQQYGSSWKQRGGVGAFMMLARKWDRLHTALAPANDTDAAHIAGMSYRSPEGHMVAPWDIFGAIAADERAEGIIDDIRDLRRYLLLVESEMVARGKAKATHRDNHADRTGMEEPFGYQGEG